MNSRPYSTPPRRTWRWLRTGLFSGALALIAATISPTVHGQSVIIGTDAVSTAGTGSDPTDDFYTKMRYQTVYLASELTAGGVPARSSITAAMKLPKSVVGPIERPSTVEARSSRSVFQIERGT